MESFEGLIKRFDQPIFSTNREFRDTALKIGQIRQDSILGLRLFTDKDKDGKSVVEHLERVAKECDPTVLPSGSVQADKLLELMQEFASPFNSKQQQDAALAPEAISNIVMLRNPAEWTRLVVELMQKGTAEAAGGGVELKLPAGMWDPSNKPAWEQRSYCAVLMHSAIKNTFAEAGRSYQFAGDKYRLSNATTGTKGKQGEIVAKMDSASERKALEALTGSCFSPADTLTRHNCERATNRGLFANLTWSSDPQPKSHTVVIIGCVQEGDTTLVEFRNSRGSGGWKDGDLVVGDGPKRRVVDAASGIETMSKEEFDKRLQYAFVAEEDGIEEPVDEGSLKRANLPDRGRRWAFVGGLILAAMGTGAGVYSAYFRGKDPISARAEKREVFDPAIVGEGPIDVPVRATAADEETASDATVTPTAQLDALTEEQARQSLPHQFLGAKEWKTLFGEDVAPARGFPLALTRKLLSEPCPISENGNTIAATHQAILVPGGLTLEKLQELCKQSGVDFFFDNRSLQDDPALKETASSSYWALTVEPQASNSPFVKSLLHKSDVGQQGAFSDSYPAHKINSVREVVISILLAQSNPSEPCPSITVICAERDLAYRPIAVRYEAEKKKIVLSTTTSYPEAIISPGFDLKKALQ